MHRGEGGFCDGCAIGRGKQRLVYESKKYEKDT